MSYRKIIGLTGRAESGKSTYAAAIGFTRLSFAKPLKDMVSVLLDTLGYDGGRLVSTSEGKHTSIPELGGHQVRYLLQTLGTEWGRQLIHEDIWIRIAVAQAVNLTAVGGAVVLDDIRFDNEADAIREAGGLVVHLVREHKGLLNSDAGSHVSERPVHVAKGDRVFYNVAGLDELQIHAAATRALVLGGAE